MTTLDVVGVGCTAVDTLGIYEGPILVDEKMEMHHATQQGGGLVGTGLVAVARLGGKARYVGTVGDDDHAQFAVREYQREGIDTSCIRIVPGMSVIRSIVVVDPSKGHRTILYCLDDVPVLDPAAMRREEVIAGAVVFVDGFFLAPAIQAARWGREAGRIVLMDAELTAPENDTLTALATHVVASIAFARSRVGDCDFIEAAKRLHGKLVAKDPAKVVAVTAGPKGSYFISSTEQFHQPALPPPKLVDTTGCGDVFHGAVAFGLARRWPLRRVAEFAAAVAALKCRKLGGRAGIPSFAETEQFLAAAKGG